MNLSRLMKIDHIDPGDRLKILAESTHILVLKHEIKRHNVCGTWGLNKHIFSFIVICVAER